MNFLRRLALQEKKLDDSSRLDVVEIARVPEHASELVSFLFGLRTYQNPGINRIRGQNTNNYKSVQQNGRGNADCV